MALSRSSKHRRGQSTVELALTLPIILILLYGMVEVVFAGRTYLALLEATVAGARFGSGGEFFFDNNEVFMLVTQKLSSEGYTSSQLIDVIIIRADLIGGTAVQNYTVSSLLGSGRLPQINASTLLTRLNSGDPSVSIIVVEIIYDHNLLLDFPLMTALLPDPFPLRAYTVQYIQR